MSLELAELKTPALQLWRLRGDSTMTCLALVRFLFEVGSADK